MPRPPAVCRGGMYLRVRASPRCGVACHGTHSAPCVRTGQRGSTLEATAPVLRRCCSAAVAAHIGTGDFLQSILNLLMLNDTVGTALVMFMVAKHFETAVVTSGNDITSLMRVRPPPRLQRTCNRMPTT